MANDRSIVWFRRDLRIDDHPALTHAGRDGREVVPLFVIDPALARPSGAVRLAFMYRSLRSLDASLGGTLVVRHGDPVDVVATVAAEAGASEVVVSRDYAPYGRRRDARVAERLARDGVAFAGKGSPYAVAPGTVVKDDGTPYAVFTPFSRAWIATGWRDPIGRADVDTSAARSVASDGIPDDPPIEADLPEASESAAHARWESFLGDDLDQYDSTRNTPGRPGTSRMSPYLRWGQVHSRQLLADLGDARSHAVFRSELAWREFYADVLFHDPDSARRNLQRKMDAMALDTDGDALDRFRAWATGTTGYPIVDAGMRQLLATGWMHNRVRMITASFLVKDLHLPWQWGARHFMQHLVDGDLASNQHGWQWTAGTGTDAAPYFRVFNPASQSERFDPDGDYIRRWVPELAELTGKEIHAPAGSRTGLPAGARPPMVDHAAERVEALKRYRDAMGR
jgi:deoxyribodipyrimidine photo-lyase